MKIASDHVAVVASRSRQMHDEHEIGNANDRRISNAWQINLFILCAFATCGWVPCVIGRGNSKEFSVADNHHDGRRRSEKRTHITYKTEQIVSGDAFYLHQQQSTVDHKPLQSLRTDGIDCRQSCTSALSLSLSINLQAIERRLHS